MKINVEKRLHETAQELEKLAWLCSNSATCPSLIALNDALRHSAWLMRLARSGMAYRAGKIEELEEEISIWRSFMVPEPVRGQRWAREAKEAAQEPVHASREEIRRAVREVSREVCGNE